MDGRRDEVLRNVGESILGIQEADASLHTGSTILDHTTRPRTLSEGARDSVNVMNEVLEKIGQELLCVTTPVSALVLLVSGGLISRVDVQVGHMVSATSAPWLEAEARQGGEMAAEVLLERTAALQSDSLVLRDGRKHVLNETGMRVCTPLHNAVLGVNLEGDIDKPMSCGLPFGNEVRVDGVQDSSKGILASEWILGVVSTGGLHAFGLDLKKGVFKAFTEVGEAVEELLRELRQKHLGDVLGKCAKLATVTANDLGDVMERHWPLDCEFGGDGLEGGKDGMIIDGGQDLLIEGGRDMGVVSLGEEEATLVSGPELEAEAIRDFMKWDLKGAVLNDSKGERNNEHSKLK